MHGVHPMGKSQGPKKNQRESPIIQIWGEPWLWTSWFPPLIGLQRRRSRIRCTLQPIPPPPFCFTLAFVYVGKTQVGHDVLKIQTWELKTKEVSQSGIVLTSILEVLAVISHINIAFHSWNAWQTISLNKEYKPGICSGYMCAFSAGNRGKGLGTEGY